jgi:hypothetical protein
MELGHLQATYLRVLHRIALGYEEKPASPFFSLPVGIPQSPATPLRPHSREPPALAAVARLPLPPCIGGHRCPPAIARMIGSQFMGAAAAGSSSPDWGIQSPPSAPLLDCPDCHVQLVRIRSWVILIISLRAWGFLVTLLCWNLCLDALMIIRPTIKKLLNWCICSFLFFSVDDWYSIQIA